MNKTKYIRSVSRRLNLPKEVRQRVMADLESDIEARLEAGMTWENLMTELGSPKKAAADLNEQMKDFSFRKSPWRYLFAATAVLSGGWLILYRLFLRFGMLFNTLSITSYPAPASSIGIIGGADGPTSIFIAGYINPSAGIDWDLVLVGAILVISILAFLRLRRCKQK